MKFKVFRTNRGINMELKDYSKTIAETLSNYLYNYTIEELKLMKKGDYGMSKQITKDTIFYVVDDELRIQEAPKYTIPFLKKPKKEEVFENEEGFYNSKKIYYRFKVSYDALENKQMILLALEDGIKQILNKTHSKAIIFSLCIVPDFIDSVLGYEDLTNNYITFAIKCKQNIKIKEV
ncbi:MAG TPA: hypothetical protein ENG48_04380 [Candidatus Atribacteria bacterium]|nr:hypothetical protein [Candidatus Atribacteria bacterium]